MREGYPPYRPYPIGYLVPKCRVFQIFIKLYTVESRCDEHLYNEILSVPNYILCPGSREICVTGLKEPRYSKASLHIYFPVPWPFVILIEVPLLISVKSGLIY